MGAVEELQQAASVVAERVGPAVVRIGRAPGRGAGVVIGAGEVATNAHNLRGEHTTVTFADGRVETGRVAGVDVDGDLAVVAVDTASIAAPEWGEPASTGLPVFALATSASGDLRVSFGLVSTVGQAFRGPRGRRIVGSLEHTAPLRRGSSGGPVVDGSGRLLGLNTHRLGDGFYLALPADDELRARLGALAQGRSPSRRHLGVALAPADAARRLRRAVGLPERDGLLVRAVQADSPAERAGLREGDLIVAASGSAVFSADDLHAALDAVDEGGSLLLRIVRGSEELDVTVTFPGGEEQGSS
ncbi:MAG: S1C family serine protease [Actinomycetota bacterium]|nr:S1C family serine protease [Actinomycetota bacterium]